MFSYNRLNHGYIDPEIICCSSFILDYLEKLQIPRIPQESLRLIEGDTLDQPEGSSGTVYLYHWEIIIEVEESGYYNPTTQEKITEFTETRRVPISIPVIVKKIDTVSVINHTIPIAQFLNELKKLCGLKKRETHNLLLSTATASAPFNTHTLTSARILPDYTEQQPRPKPSDPYYSIDPHIVNCYGYCFQANAPNDDFSSYTTSDVQQEEYELWVVMEYATKGSLDTEKIQAWNPFERIKACLDICEGLYTTHTSNVIHGDLKPANILVGDDGVYKLADFGSAFSASEQFYLFSEEDLFFLQNKIDFLAHTPAIVQISKKDSFHFYFIVNSSNSLELDLEPIDSYTQKTLGKFWEFDRKDLRLYCVKCPTDLAEDLSKFFIQHPRCYSDNLEISPLLIPNAHRVMHYLTTKIEYCKSPIENILRKNQCIGSPLWLAPELCRSLYFCEPSPTEFFYTEPTFYTDIYSLGMILYEIWTGKIPDVSPGARNGALYKIIAEDKKRPLITHMYSDEGLVPVAALQAEHKTLRVKKIIEACWDNDPSKRPKITELIDFFRIWLDETLVKSITHYQPKEEPYFLNAIPDLSWFLRIIPNFRDHEARPTTALSLLQYSFWSAHPLLGTLLTSFKFPKSDIQAQIDHLKQSVWVKKNGLHALDQLKLLLQAYENFSKLQSDTEKKTCWFNIGFLQRRLPTYMFFRYCELQKIEVQSASHQITPLIDLWYQTPTVPTDPQKPLLLYYKACYCDQKKQTLCKKEIAQLDPEPTFEDFDCEKEKNIAQTLFAETLTRSETLQKSFFHHHL